MAGAHAQRAQQHTHRAASPRSLALLFDVPASPPSIHLIYCLNPRLACTLKWPSHHVSVEAPARMHAPGVQRRRAFACTARMRVAGARMQLQASAVQLAVRASLITAHARSAVMLRPARCAACGGGAWGRQLRPATHVSQPARLASPTRPSAGTSETRAAQRVPLRPTTHETAGAGRVGGEGASLACRSPAPYSRPGALRGRSGFRVDTAPPPRPRRRCRLA